MPSPAAARLRARLRPAASRTERSADRSPWRCLRTPSMRWWSAANLFSNLGTWMQLTVQNLLVLQLTGSAAATGVSLAVQAAPGLLLGLVGGAAVDAWPRKLTAAVSQAVLAAVAFTTAGLVTFHLLTVPLLLVLSAVTGTIATVDGPATSLLGNDLVRREDVPSAIALGSVVHSVGRLAGTALAGVGLATVGPAGAYAVNGLSFLFVTAVVPFLKLVEQPPEPVVRPAAPAPAARRAGTVAALRDGLGYFLGRPRLVALAVICAVSSVLGRNYGLTLATLVTGPLHGGAGAYGVVSTVLAVGGTAGAVLAGRLRRPSVRLVGALAVAGAALQVVAGFSPVLLFLLVLVVPMAVVESVSDTAATTVLQTDPPARARGRVLGVWRSLSTGWGLVGPPLLGLLVQAAGARGALVAGGLVIVGVIGAGALAHGRRTARVTEVAVHPTEAVGKPVVTAA
ncbi:MULTISPECIES: MFS transporter [Streptomycetaceae]|uniref:Transmembrane transport protein n=1 Tax=Streptantibioticus cattleyicolor (strain ATCC 35852 / DSM 46488 / JCM 4925 / NBRC 14057 / NRRL 8057) TaxID=1003195 RepID=F8JRJ2_STREN|nr:MULTISPECIES: MFS transporter [Streptomycetaceae]AEW97878.1 transmembrane transport protein [Streptantibioticus cattleyicolor NRRL 8057 = DSM 46488]MYS62288.1 MFS transporter [Streptomyces sp. SID5468]CCB78193.1 putative transmembrane transport protein [Streptantibioticus cattleyicolor NRRL 8057 = DSM 46488]